MINADELLLTVDEQNQPIKLLPRSEVHRDGHWHRVAHVWVICPEQEILCQQRSLLKDASAGLWEPFFGGHLVGEQDYLTGAVGELHEELGIQAKAEDLIEFGIIKSQKNKEFQGVYLYKWSGQDKDLVLEPDEVAAIRRHSTAELYDLLVIQHRPEWSHAVYEEDLLRSLQERFVW